MNKTFGRAASKIIGMGERFIPDKIYLERLYFKKYGKKINWKNPVTYNEKLQWLKVNDRNPLYTQLADKAESKKYVEQKVGEAYVIKTFGIYKTFADINFSQLPDRFVLKTTHSSGAVIIVRDKNDFDKQKADRVLSESLKHNLFWAGREWVYKNIPPGIIAEEFLCDRENDKDIVSNYKFFCFDGEPFIYYITVGMPHTESVRIQYFNMNDEEINVRNTYYPRYNGVIDIPDAINEMKELCRKLSVGIPHVRIDFYYVNHRIYVGEFTFYTDSGLAIYEPEEFDIEMGKKLDLSQINRL